MSVHGKSLSGTSRVFHAPVLILLAAFLALAAPATISANSIQQFDTRYFTIIFDEDGEYTAGEIARFCDDVYENLMALYGGFSDAPRVTCIVNDAADIANGYAVEYENTITIYATNLDFELRGQTAWLRNVFTHEMTHLVALKQAEKGPVNFISIGGGKYNKNPDFDVDLLWSNVSQPTWFTEGIAQLGSETYGADSWDTHRDMLLRSAWLSGDLLTLPEMSALSGCTSLDAELVYNQGYSLVRYIRDTYGQKKITELNRAQSLTDFAPAVMQALGISAEKLYENWKTSLDGRYGSFKVLPRTSGELVADLGTADYYPALSPDGTYLAFLSNPNRDYTITDLMLMNMKTGVTRKIVEDVDYRVAWSHDSSLLVYVKRPPQSPKYYDIFTYDVATGIERRISKNLRARDPSFSPGDSLIVFVKNAQGQNQLGIIDADGSQCRFLTAATDGTQFYTPSFSPDGGKILFGVFRQDGDRDIAMIDAASLTFRHPWEMADSTSGFADSTLFSDNAGFRLLAGSRADERDPCFTPDGAGIVYVSDRSGVFNAYLLSPAEGKTVRLTDCSGGVFSPMAADNGDLYFAGYAGKDFSIYRTRLAGTIETTGIIAENRDYMRQPKPFILSDFFSVSPYQRQRVLNALVPTLRIGPSFIGSQFGLDVIDAGGQVYLSDLIGYDTIMFGGSIGKNIRESVDLNSDLYVAYERSLVPFTSSSREHSPRLFIEASRTVINNLMERYHGLEEQTTYGDIPELGYMNVIQDIHQTVTVNDEYRDEFRRAQAGIDIPLANRQSLQIEGGYRQYFESLNRFQTMRDFSNFFVNGLDITDTVDGAHLTTTDQSHYFNDMNFFKDYEFGITYTYAHTEQAADNDVSPKGTAFYFQVAHHRSAITDSLVDQPALFAPVYVNYNGQIQLEPYNPDDYQDLLRPTRQQRDHNEYTIILKNSHRLPWWKHAYDLQLVGAYRDISLKDVNKGEGSGYNWPLKYYLGGEGMLSGYPYFAFSGTKLAYARLGYTVPVRSRISLDFAGVQIQKLYGTVFCETANVWNFKQLSMDNLRKSSFKSDLCVELRLGMVTFYRFPAIAYGRVAWPLNKLDYPGEERDARRFYFGLRME